MRRGISGMQGMIAKLLNEFAEAWCLLLRIPCPIPTRRARPGVAKSSFWAYPAIGFLVACLGAIIFAGIRSVGLPVEIAAGLALGSQILATGALHEDGLTDFFDGLGGESAKRRLQIMADSRLGVFGGCALFLILMLRWSAMVTLSNGGVLFAGLLVGACMSRAIVPFVPLLLLPARPGGLGSSVAEPRAGSVLAGLAIAVVIVILFVSFLAALLATITAFAMCAVVCWMSLRLLKGYTGDVLGALQQLSETALLLVMIILLVL